MRIDELSIGDWVEVLIANKARVSKVEGIRWNDILRKYVVEVCNGAFRLQDCYILPIPLTPEILEKNGISKTYESDEYAVYKGEGFNVTEYYTELWEFERHRNRLMIKNVHQLQHALRLAGIEKEIVV